MRFVAGYVAVLSVMFAWWLALQVLTELSVPAWTVLGAYAVPFAAWGLVVATARMRRRT